MHKYHNHHHSLSTYCALGTLWVTYTGYDEQSPYRCQAPLDLKETSLRAGNLPEAALGFDGIRINPGPSGQCSLRKASITAAQPHSGPFQLVSFAMSSTYPQVPSFKLLWSELCPTSRPNCFVEALTPNMTIWSRGL